MTLSGGLVGEKDPDFVLAFEQIVR